MMSRGRVSARTLCLAALVTSLVGFAPPVQAGVIFSGSGSNPETGTNPVAGTAQFTISGNNLTIVLTNTTSPRTTAQGDALTGVTYDISGPSGPLSLSSIALTSGSLIWTSKTASNTSDPLSGSWTTVLGGSPLGEYGVATTGFNGRFNGGSISVGNASPNYGIVAASTFTGSSGVSFGGGQFPFIQNSLTFTFTGASGLSEANITNVKLLFGTDGTGIVSTAPSIAAVPEPSSAVLVLTGLLGCGFATIRRIRKASSQAR